MMDGEDPRLVELVCRWRELAAIGQKARPADLTDDPGLAGVLAEAIADTIRVEQLLGGTPPSAPSASGVEGRYEILGLHAIGGMGAVFKARDLKTGGRVVAYKVIREGLSSSSPSIDSFYREPIVTDSLRHPGIVPVYALVEDGSGRPAYAMEFIEGDTLAEALNGDVAGAPKGTREILQKFVEACEIVASAHAKGFVHSDLSTKNIMILRGGKSVRVIDWGSASNPSMRTDSPARTAVTPGFHDPALDAGASPTFASDVYSLGVCLEKIANRATPDDFSKSGSRRFSDPIGVLRAISARATAEKSGDRYADAAALAEDLTAFLSGESVDAYREPALDRVWRWMSRHRAAVTVAILTSFVALVAAAFLYKSRVESRNREELSREVALFYRVSAALARFDGIRSGISRSPADVAEEARLVGGFLESGGTAHFRADEMADSVQRFNAWKESDGTRTAVDRHTESEKEMRLALDLLGDMEGRHPKNKPLYNYYKGQIYSSLAALKVVSLDVPSMTRIAAAFVANARAAAPERIRDLEMALEWTDLADAAFRAGPPGSSLLERKDAMLLWETKSICLMLLGRFTEAMQASEQAEKVVPDAKRDWLVGTAPIVRMAAEIEQSRLPWSRQPNANHAKAMKMAEYLMTRPGVSLKARYNAACVFALASRDGGVPSSMRERRAGRAMQLLEGLAEHGYFRSPAIIIPGFALPGMKDTQAELRSDKDLDSLRERPDFAAILGRYDKK